ncbi:MAG TPA: hypothetical protein VN843_33235, partial [Anaerolineales bacterium]|nr:hypothetical protein [Anaerolineales bacterium]
CHLFVNEADVRVFHRRFGIAYGFPETLAVCLLGGAPLDTGHIWTINHGELAGVGTPEDQVAYFARDEFKDGVEFCFCHVMTFLYE